MEGYWMTSIAWTLVSRAGGARRLLADQRVEVAEGILTRVAWPSDDPRMVMVTPDGESMRLALDTKRTRIWRRCTELAWDEVRPGQRAVVYYWLHPGLDLARDIEVFDDPAKDETRAEASWYERLEASNQWAQLTAVAVFATD